jgi:excisionase family DNA binding protein
MLHTRTISEAAAWFREQDPNTCLTVTAIRRLLRTGTVPSVRIGKKYLVTLEALESYLSGSDGNEGEP